MLLSRENILTHIINDWLGGTLLTFVWIVSQPIPKSWLQFFSWPVLYIWSVTPKRWDQAPLNTQGWRCPTVSHLGRGLLTSFWLLGIERHIVVTVHPQPKDAERSRRRRKQPVPPKRSEAEGPDDTTEHPTPGAYWWVQSAIIPHPLIPV